MPRKPEPWYRSDRKAWYVQIRGTQHRLGKKKDEADRRYHELMAEQPPDTGIYDTVSQIGDRYLDFVQKQRSPRTYEWYRDFWQDFLDWGAARMEASQLRPRDVYDWLDSHPAWGQSTRHGAITAISGAFRYAVRNGDLDRNPLAGIERPGIATRELVIPEKDYRYMLRKSDEDFADLLTVAWETGARPQEIRGVTAAHLTRDGTWLFPRATSKGKKRRRVVYLTDRSLEICRRRVRKQGQGAIFRNSKGTPWDGNSTACRFRRFERAKHLGIKYCLYNFRHTFATRCLQKGMSPVVLAEIMGHTDMTMLTRVYSHLSQSPEVLRSQLQGMS